MKKKILFITQQLGCGGVEKALINLLNLIDREKYDVDILVMNAGGEFRDAFPAWAEIYEYQCPGYVKEMVDFFKKPCFKKGDNVKVVFDKIKWKIIYDFNKVARKIFCKNIMYYFCYKKYKTINDYSSYDAIIDFHGYGMFTTYLAAYLSEKSKRISWIHEQTIYDTYRSIRKVYDRFDRIFACSKDSKKNFITSFNECSSKVDVYYNYVDVKEIRKKALDNCEIDKSEFNVVSVGRVCGQKAFDRILDVVDILVERNMQFRWTVVGDGEDICTLRKRCINEGKTKYIDFIGYRENPYPYIYNADIYVQTSVVEGFCTTITEAVALGKAIVSTRVSGIEEQLDFGKGGIICEQDIKLIANAIITLMNDREF